MAMQQLTQKEKIAVIVSGVLFLLFVISLFWQRTPRILIVHSYNLDYIWTADLDKSIHSVLDGQPYDVQRIFMDTKRKSFIEYKKEKGKEVQELIDKWKPDIIIAADDDAQEYAVKKYVNTSMKILFCGVNNDITDYGYDKANNVTGLLERQDYLNVKNILYHLSPSQQKRFVHLSEDSTTALGTRKELEVIDWSPVKFVSSVQVKTFEDWKKAVIEAADISDLIVISQYNSVKKEADSNETIPPKEIIRWTLDNSKIPVIGLFQFFVEDGGAFSAGPSEQEHGEFVAKTAINLLEKKVKIKDVPITKNKHFMLSIRNKQGKITKRRMVELDLSAIYDAYALLGK
jgi:ABC-type uncharacterized transport system substrate-binding protein